jgi:hypothetical protein
MGHVRLGVLPQSKKWQRVVEDLRLGADLSATAAAEAAEASLRRVASDDAFVHSVAVCLKALEWSGLLTWAHRIDPVLESCVDLCDRQSWRLKVVVRASNCVRDPLRSAFDFGTGTRTDALISSEQAPARDCVRELVGPLKVALASLGATVKAKEDRIQQEGGGIACALGTAT